MIPGSREWRDTFFNYCKLRETQWHLPKYHAKVVYLIVRLQGKRILELMVLQCQLSGNQESK